MAHDQLWAPWRLAYIRGEAASEPALPPALLPGGDEKCFLCRAAAGTDDRANLVVCRGPRTLAVLNRFPYNNGHLMISPQRHLGRLEEIDAETHAEVVAVMIRATLAIERLMSAHGFNVGVNLGRAAGAGVPRHLHWHVVPRWEGDTNFMPVLTDAKVISQSLDSLWELLAPALAEG